MAEKYLVRRGDEETTLEVRRDGDLTFVRREGAEPWQQVELEPVGDSGLCLLMIDNHPVEIYLERRRGGAIVTIGRHSFNYDVGPWRPGGARPARRATAAAGLVRIAAPMTGSVLEARCQPGDRVEAGATLFIIESMKMNNELRSPAAGVIESVAVVAGQRIKAGDFLASLQA